MCIHYGHLKYLFCQCLPLSEVFNPFIVNNHSKVIFRCHFIILLLVFCLISFPTFISSKLLHISMLSKYFIAHCFISFLPGIFSVGSQGLWNYINLCHSQEFLLSTHSSAHALGLPSWRGWGFTKPHVGMVFLHLCFYVLLPVPCM